MPCYNPMNDMDPSEVDKALYKDELDRVTAILCATLNHLRRNSYDLKLEIYNGLPLEIRSWHKGHKVHDIKTKQLEIRDLQQKQETLEAMKQRILDEIKEIENE